MREPVSTVDWPQEALAHEGPVRGSPRVRPELCTGCRDCVDACPAGCITIPEGVLTPTVDAGPCVRCGACERVCDGGAIALDGPRLLAAYSRGDLVLDGEAPAPQDVGPAPGRLYRMAISPDDQGEVRAEELLARRSRSLGLESEDMRGSEPGR